MADEPSISPLKSPTKAVSSSHQEAATSKAIKEKSKTASLSSKESAKPPIKSPQKSMDGKKHPIVLKSLNPVKSPEAAKSRNPTMLNMVLEALKNNASAKGLTTQGMKRYIAERYPSSQETFSNIRFKKAFLKGLEGKEIIRPKSSEDTGMKGYFLLNRVLHSQRDKDKQQALGTKEKSAIPDNKLLKKKVSKTVVKNQSISKSSKSGKLSPKKVKALRKIATKSPEIESQIASEKKDVKKLAKKKSSKKNESPVVATPPKQKTTKATATPKRKITKATVTQKIKSTKVTHKISKNTKFSVTSELSKATEATATPKLSKTKQATAKATPKSSKPTKATATPKLSKSIKAGTRQKTAVVKNLMKSTC